MNHLLISDLVQEGTTAFVVGGDMIEMREDYTNISEIILQKSLIKLL